eukprot:766785-Hanusia_phi.AAC.3
MCFGARLTVCGRLSPVSLGRRRCQRFSAPRPRVTLRRRAARRITGPRPGPAALSVPHAGTVPGPRQPRPSRRLTESTHRHGPYRPAYGKVRLHSGTAVIPYVRSAGSFQVFGPGLTEAFGSH